MSTQEQRRQSIGTALEAGRRSIGDAMIQRRTGQDLVDSLGRLAPASRSRKTLSTLDAIGALPAARGTAPWVESRPGSSTAGIASPLTETDYSTRQYWPEQTIESVDGLLSFRIKPIKQITQADANGAEVLQVFAPPPAEAP